MHTVALGAKVRAAFRTIYVAAFGVGVAGMGRDRRAIDHVDNLKPAVLLFVGSEIGKLTDERQHRVELDVTLVGCGGEVVMLFL